MYMYNLSPYFDVNNKFTIIPIKENNVKNYGYKTNSFSKNITLKKIIQPKMVFTPASYRTNYENTIEKLKELRKLRKC